MKTIRCIIHVSVPRRKTRSGRSASALLTRRAILDMAAVMCSSSYRSTERYYTDPRRKQSDSPDLTASYQDIWNILAAGDEKTESLKAVIMRIIGYSGLRRRELAELRWSDIDFDSGRAMLRATKSGHDQCVVLGSNALSALKELHRSTPESEYVLGSDMPSLVRRAMVELRVLAGKPFTFHSLRRFFMSKIARTGGDGEKA